VAAACWIVTVCPAIVAVPVRATPSLAATLKTTAPAPVDTAIHVAFDAALHEQPLPVLTLTETEAAAALTEADVVLKLKAHANVALKVSGPVTVNVDGLPDMPFVHPANVYPAEGVAVNWIAVPAATQPGAGATLPPVPAVAETMYSLRYVRVHAPGAATKVLGFAVTLSDHCVNKCRAEAASKLCAVTVQEAPGVQLRVAVPVYVPG
jgi:hypothetical protein